MTATALDAGDGLEDAKAAGFHGICFDIELTIGEQISRTQERALQPARRRGFS